MTNTWAGTHAAPIQTRIWPKSTWACAPGGVSNRTVAALGSAATRSGRTARRTMIAEPTKPCACSSRVSTAAL